MCFAPQRRALFHIATSKRCVLYILTWKCASRHNGVHFFDISTSKCGLDLVCFVHFDLKACFAPQRRALFRHHKCQKWSAPLLFCTFWLRNLFRATTECTFSGGFTIGLWKIYGGFMEDSWRIYGGFTVDLWWIYGGLRRFIEDFGGFIVDLRWIYGRFTVALWRIYGGVMKDLWRIYGGFTEDLRWIYRGFIVDLWTPAESVYFHHRTKQAQPSPEPKAEVSEQHQSGFNLACAVRTEQPTATLTPQSHCKVPTCANQSWALRFLGIY